MNAKVTLVVCLPLGELSAESKLGELDRLLPTEVTETLCWKGVGGSLCVDLVDGDRCRGSAGHETLRNILCRCNFTSGLDI